MKTLLVIAALVCAIILTLIGFGWVGADDPRVFGWLGLTLAFFIAAHLPLDRYFR